MEKIINNQPRNVPFKEYLLTKQMVRKCEELFVCKSSRVLFTLQCLEE
jgi:hypothetical protein